MFARVGRYSGDAAAMRAGFESVTPELERIEGFKEAFFLADAESGHGMSITLWESRDALEASADAAKGMRARATEQAGGTIEGVETFEVILTVGGGSRAG